MKRVEGRIEESGLNWTWNGGPILIFVLCSGLVPVLGFRELLTLFGMSSCFFP